MTTRQSPSVPHKRKVPIGAPLGEYNQRPTTFNNHNRLDDDLSSIIGAGGGLNAARQISHTGLFSSISDSNLHGLGKKTPSKDKDSEKDRRAESEKEVKREKDLIPDSIIGAGVDIKGTMAFKSLLRVDGRFEGELVSKGNITVSSTGLIVGNIANINCLTINGGGKVFGNISAEKVIILDNGCIEGDLSCKMLQMGFSGSIIGRMYVHPQGGGKYESPETTVRKDLSKGAAKKRRNSVVNTVIVLNDGSTGERMNIEPNTPREWDDVRYDDDDYEVDQSPTDSRTLQIHCESQRSSRGGRRSFQIPSFEAPHYVSGGGGSLSERTGIRNSISHPSTHGHGHGQGYGHDQATSSSASTSKKDGVTSSSKKTLKDNIEKDQMKRRDSSCNSANGQQRGKEINQRRNHSISERRAEKAELQELKKEENRLEELVREDAIKKKYEEDVEKEKVLAKVRVAEKIAAEEKEWMDKEEKKIREEVERDMIEREKIKEEKSRKEEEEFEVMENLRKEEDQKKKDDKDKEKIRIENEWKEGEDKKKKEKEAKKFLELEARRKEIEMIERIERQRNENSDKNSYNKTNNEKDKEKNRKEDEKSKTNHNQNFDEDAALGKSQKHNRGVPLKKNDGDEDGGEYDDENWDDRSEVSSRKKERDR